MFFTRIPLPSLPNWKAEDQRYSAMYFPFMGWWVGGIAALVWWGAIHLWSTGIASLLSLAATLLLTGAFHEDGFADVCDGFGGGTTKERVLEIMRDSRVGAFGAIGVAVMLIAKWDTVAELPAVLRTMGSVIAAHAVSRGAAASLLATSPYVREEIGKAKPLATELSWPRLAIALGFAIVPMALLPLRWWWALLPVALARTAMEFWFRYRIGGYTGDCLGAVQQVCEITFYLSILALIR